MMDKKTSPENIELLLTCAWALWGNKNDIRHGGKRKDGRMLLQWAMQYLEEYRAAVELIPIFRSQFSLFRDGFHHLYWFSSSMLMVLCLQS